MPAPPPPQSHAPPGPKGPGPHGGGGSGPHGAGGLPPRAPRRAAPGPMHGGGFCHGVIFNPLRVGIVIHCHPWHAIHCRSGHGVVYHSMACGSFLAGLPSIAVSIVVCCCLPTAIDSSGWQRCTEKDEKGLYESIWAMSFE